MISVSLVTTAWPTNTHGNCKYTE